jgi:hypothetical protein
MDLKAAYRDTYRIMFDEAATVPGRTAGERSAEQEDSVGG